MARFSLVTIASALLITYAIGQVNEAHTLARGIAHHSAHNMLRKASSVRTAASDKVRFTGKFRGVYKFMASVLNYSGNFRGTATTGKIDATYDSVFNGIYKMMGYDGNVNGDCRGIFKARVGAVEGTGTSTVDSRFTSRFSGTVEGIPANMACTGTSMLISTALSPTEIKVKVTESGDFTSTVGGKTATGVFSSVMTEDMFSSKVSGMINGKKFEFTFSGMVEDLLELIKIENTGSYEISSGGKTTKGSYKFDGLKLIEG